MRIQNSKLWVKYSFGTAVQGSVAVLLCACLIRYVLQPFIEPYAPFHFFIVACLFIGYWYGYQLALVATLISAAIGNYFFVKPYFEFGPMVMTDVIQIINFASVTVISVLIIEKLQRTAYARHIAFRIMESRQKIMLYRENERLYFSKKSNESWAILDEMLTDFDDIILLQWGIGAVKVEPLFLALSHAPRPILAADEWQTLMHPEDLGWLLSGLDEPVLKSGAVDVMTLRFSTDADAAPCQVALEAFVFLGKPLKILRLTDS